MATPDDRAIYSLFAPRLAGALPLPRAGEALRETEGGYCLSARFRALAYSASMFTAMAKSIARDGHTAIDDHEPETWEWRVLSEECSLKFPALLGPWARVAKLLAEALK